jgi:hypothetical protein
MISAIAARKATMSSPKPTDQITKRKASAEALEGKARRRANQNLFRASNGWKAELLPKVP